MLGSVKIDVSSVIEGREVGRGYTVPTSPVNLRLSRSVQNPDGTGMNTSISSRGIVRAGRVYPPSSVMPIRVKSGEVVIGLTWNGKGWVVGQLYPLP